MVAKRAADLQDNDLLGPWRSGRLAAEEHNAKVDRIRREVEQCTCMQQMVDGVYGIARFDPDCPVLSTHVFTPGLEIGWIRPVLKAGVSSSEATLDGLLQSRGQQVEIEAEDETIRGTLLAARTVDSAMLEIYVDPSVVQERE